MSVAGTFKLTVETPRGTQTPTVTLKEEDGSVSGSFAGQMGTTEFSGGTVDGSSARFEVNLSAMGREIALSFDVTVEGDSISGSVKTPMGSTELTGTREG